MINWLLSKKIMIENKSPFNLKLIQKCPVCNADYVDNRLEVLEENERGVLIYLSCGNCFSNMIVRLLAMPHGLFGNAILTDLQPAEVVAYAQDGHVSGDNVLEAHQLIHKEDAFIEKLRRI